MTPFSHTSWQNETYLIKRNQLFFSKLWLPNIGKQIIKVIDNEDNFNFEACTQWKGEDKTKECKKMVACFSNVKMGCKMYETFLNETRAFFKWWFRKKVEKKGREMKFIFHKYVNPMFETYSESFKAKFFVNFTIPFIDFGFCFY